MPSVNIRKTLYDTLVKKGEDVPDFINEAVKEKIEREEEKKVG